MSVEGAPPRDFPVIEFYQLDKRKFFPLSTVGSLTVQVVTYPLNLLRTRLQLQEGRKVYKGLLHCFQSVLGQEGVRGLYAGFWVKNFQVVSSVMYAYTYERVREDTRGMSPTLRSFIGGGCASLVSQTVLVPLDVVSQHLQVLSRHQEQSAAHRALTPLSVTEEEARTAPGRAMAVVRTLYRRHGLVGFYKGYFISVAHFVPNSALWWAFYNLYCDAIGRATVGLMADGGGDSGDSRPPRLPVQLAAAPLSGMSSGLITNPIDVVRVRMQVEGLPLPATMRRLWAEEGAAFVVKGLSARLLQSSLFSFFIILSYEPIKRFSLKEEYKSSISW